MKINKIWKVLALTLLICLTTVATASAIDGGNDDWPACGIHTIFTTSNYAHENLALVGVTYGGGSWWDWPTYTANSYNGWEITRLTAYTGAGGTGYTDVSTYPTGTTSLVHQIWMYYARSVKVELQKTECPSEVVCKPVWTGRWIITYLREGNDHWATKCNLYVPDFIYNENDAKLWRWSDEYIAELCSLPGEPQTWQGTYLYLQKEFKPAQCKVDDGA